MTTTFNTTTEALLDTMRDVIIHAYKQNGITPTPVELAREVVSAWSDLTAKLAAASTANTIKIEWPNFTGVKP